MTNQDRAAPVKARLRFVAMRRNTEEVPGVATVEEEDHVAFDIDTMPLLTAVNAGTVRTAIKLAVSRLYDGPRGAPPAQVIPQPKVALCGAHGCSELRTKDGLCETHRERERLPRARAMFREARARQESERALCEIAEERMLRVLGMKVSVESAVDFDPTVEGLPLKFISAEVAKPAPLGAYPAFVRGGDGGGGGGGLARVVGAVTLNRHGQVSAGTVKIEAVGVNKHGQEAAVPIDPTVTSQPRPQCRTPGCKDRARDPGARGNFWELDPWCYDHAGEAVDGNFGRGPDSALALRERLDREKAGIGFEPTVTNAVAKSRIAVGRVVMTSGRVGGPCDKVQVRMGDGQMRTADVPLFVGAPQTGWTGRWVRVDMLTDSIVGLA